MSESPPKITVLIPTYNRAEYLAECLDSIQAQTLPVHQIIVVNDGSTDHTKEVLWPYMTAIDYLETEQLGKPSAINRGLAKISGDYLWIFDDDDVALPDAFERLVAPLERHLEYGFSYSTFFFTDTRDDGSIGSVMGEVKIPDLKKRGFLIPLLEWNFLGGAALFARTSCYREVGQFDPKLLRSQDYEMAVRIARRFSGIRVPGGPTFHYRQHQGMRGPGHDRFDSGYKNQKWLEYDQIFFRKLYEDVPLADYIPPGTHLEGKMRQALLQRLAIMAYKLLIPEVVNDLRELAQDSDRNPFSKEEYVIVRDMMFKSFYRNTGHISDCFEFFDEIRRLSFSSPAIRLLRSKVVRAMLARCRNKPSVNEILKAVRRVFRLYLFSI